MLQAESYFGLLASQQHVELCTVNLSKEPQADMDF